MKLRQPLVALASILLTFATLHACSSSAQLGQSGATTDGGPDSSAPGSGQSNGGSGNNGAADASATGGGAAGISSLFDAGVLTVPGFFTDGGGALCGSGLCTCSNGIDDDNDGKIDGLDEECTGPLDNDEGSFATGIPGDNRDPKWQDCFFDGNSGAGDDGCRYHTDCLTGKLDPSDKSCTLTQECIDFCRPLTPNGCDCFGCCGINTGSTTVFVEIASSCDFDNIDDEAKCPRCVQTTSCTNECGECELCPGKGVADLPASCYTNGPPPQDGGGTVPPPVFTCDSGEPVCASPSDCAPSTYCQFGCCVPTILQ